MPLSEHNSKLEASKSKAPNCTVMDSQPYTPDGEFLELLWENGQIVMQGGSQSVRPITNSTRRSSIATAFPSIAARLQEKGSSRDDASQRLPSFGAAVDNLPSAGGSGNCGEPVFPTPAVSSQVGGGFAAQDDDMVPWVNCPFDEYYSEFLGDFPGVNVASSPVGNNTNLVPAPAAAAQRGADPGSTMMVAKNPAAELEPHRNHRQQQAPLKHAAAGILADTNSSRIRIPTQFSQQGGPAAPPPPQPHWPNSVNCGRAKGMVEEFGSAGNSATTTQTLVYGLPGTKTQRQILTPTTKPPLPPQQQPPSSSSGIVNFSHFSRPSVLLKAGEADRLQSHNKASTVAASSNPMESTLVETSSGFKSITNPHLAIASGKGQAKQTTLLVQGHRSVNRSDPVNWKYASTNNNNNTNNNVFNGTTTLNNDNTKRPSPDRLHSKMPVPPERKEPERPPDTVVASSSVCSGIGAGVSSNDPRSRAKRKIQEGEESGYQSEDLEDESVGGMKKQSTARVKRSRAAEVHNLSERRRRDRINEKMRALQELIPNCNKVDKASMLDEAIEYLKTLQLQIQIMSMGNSMCMPHMMFPAAMQQLRQPPLAHMPHLGLGMGMGMGMGMGFGMGMVDMNGSPLMPSAMQGPQFPCSMMTGTPGLHSIPGSSGLQMFGMPTQGIPIRMPCGPSYPSLGAQPTAASSGMLDVPRSAPGVMHPSEIAPGCSDGVAVNNNMNSDSGNGQGSGDSEIPLTTQATTECADQSVSTQLMNQTSNSDDPNSSSGNGNSSTGTSYG